MKYLFEGISFLIILLIYSCSGAGEKSPVSLTWNNDGYNSQTGCYDNTFVIKNVSKKQIDKEWVIYFSQLPREISFVETNEVGIEVVNSNYFKIYPTTNFQGLQPDDSIVVNYGVTNEVPNVSQEPEGCYWVMSVDGQEQDPMAIDLHIVPSTNTTKMSNLIATRAYEFNKQLSDKKLPLKQSDILPAVKQMDEKQTELIIPSTVSLEYEKELANEATILKEKLKSLYKIEISDKAPVAIKLNLISSSNYSNEEWYRLDIDTDEIVIESSTPHGSFNGIQTLLALMKGLKSSDKLECVTITDYPDLHHRGFMLDIARNFTEVEDLKKMIDILASYKLNVLHLHFSDDEGWRIEIPGLEELTEVSAKRGHTIDELENLYPGYDGGYDPHAKTSGNGYYTREEFIDLLKYANDRHMRVIPEVESPSHARASIVAMKARYNKYINTDEDKAREYLLSEFEDTSTYISAQSYTDNVMNVALPSTYRFMEKVISEIKRMYADAEVELPSIHIGGDEVPSGAWEGSPSCQFLMEKEGMSTTHELYEYFYLKIIDYMKQQGIKFNGWQEVALNNAADTDKKLSSMADGINCWNTVPEWGADEIPYQIANNGYPIILCNVNNVYMDLTYSPLYEERGHTWAGYVDESKSFSLLPFSIYRSSRTDIAGYPTNLDKLESGKELLRTDRKPAIKGIQAQLFAETIRGYDWVEYYVFPKILGLVERGWNAHPEWEMMRGDEEKDAFFRDLSRFYTLINDKEFPYLNTQDVNFRLPNPGLVLDDNYLHINTPIPGATIYYTTDDTEPNENSMVWTKPVKCEGATVKACISYLGKKSMTTRFNVN